MDKRSRSSKSCQELNHKMLAQSSTLFLRKHNMFQLFYPFQPPYVGGSAKAMLKKRLKLLNGLNCFRLSPSFGLFFNLLPYHFAFAFDLATRNRPRLKLTISGNPSNIYGVVEVIDTHICRYISLKQL
jgi:hypothetical protein